jgi:diguanylate cyclase (GGDEF)-like protein
VFLIYGGVVLVLFFFVGVWFAKQITKPLLSLVHQIESVAAGDYRKRFDVDSNDEVGQVVDYFEYLTGILKRKEAEIARVTDLASKDPLTGLYNHRHFRNHLEQKWKEIESGRGGSIIIIDVDDFRMFNHAHGHIQGDLVLKELAQAIKDTVKNFGLTARYGSEEIVVWCPGLDQKAGFDMSENILKKIRSLKTTSLTGGNPYTVTCSIGVTSFNKGRHPNIDQFLKDADYNMHMAKKSGKNRIWAGAV